MNAALLKAKKRKKKSTKRYEEKKKEFKDYGDEAEAVMYATATKMAKGK